MSSHRPSTSLRLALAAAMVLGSLGEARAQTAAVGLSSGHTRLFDNENLLGVYEPAAGDSFGWALAVGDFNGDGADDLATSIPNDDGQVGVEISDVGAVIIRYGAPGSGLQTGLASTVLNQLGVGSPDPADAGDRFGLSLASCDFDQNGYDDLAVGIPDEDHLDHVDAGAVQIHYGSPAGLPTDGDAFYTQSTPGIPGDVEDGDSFGFTLACGDFNGDGFPDLAIGAPFEDKEVNLQSPDHDAGTVAILPGSAQGLDAAAASALDQDSSGMDGSGEPQDTFGFSLAAGNFDGGIYDDLAVGVPGEIFGFDSESRVGAVHAVFGGPNGVSSNLMFSETAFGGANQEGARFGHSLATGDFDGDGKDDLAVGVPLADLNNGGLAVDAGQVDVVYGAGGIGLDFSRAQVWTQNDLLGLGNDEDGDTFANALVGADFDGDGIDDLVVAHPGESLVGVRDGAVTVMNGTLTGLTAARHNTIGPGRALFPGDGGEPNRQFGKSLATGDFDGDGHQDLVVGAPLQDVGSADVGQEMVLYGSIHSDGFDSEFEPRWLRQTQPASSLALRAPRFAGGAALAIQVDATNPAYVEHDIPTGIRSYRSRFYARLWPLSIATNRYFILLRGSFAGQTQFSLYVNRGLKENGITVGVRDNSGAEVFAPLLVPVPDGWRAIEVNWRASAPGQSNGSFDLWIDGHFYSLLNGLDNSDGVLTSVHLGAVDLLGAEASGTFQLDEYDAHRFTRSGELASFLDAALGTPAWPTDQALFNAEISVGCDRRLFCPKLVVTREQMAMFLLKSKEGPSITLPSCATPPFTDVPIASPYCSWIRELANRGVVAGCGGGNFCPQAPVSRRQMAVLLARTLEGGAFAPPACTDEPFADVSRDDEFCPFIKYLASAGITQGCGGGGFCPFDPVTRAQMATLLIEAFDLFVPEL